MCHRKITQRRETQTRGQCCRKGELRGCRQSRTPGSPRLDVTMDVIDPQTRAQSPRTPKNFMVLKMNALLCNKHLCAVNRKDCTPPEKRGIRGEGGWLCCSCLGIDDPPGKNKSDSNVKANRFCLSSKHVMHSTAYGGCLLTASVCLRVTTDESKWDVLYPSPFKWMSLIH